MDDQNQVVIPPEHIQQAVRSRLSARRAQQLETIFVVRSTAQQMENAAGEWFGGTVGSPARFQTLILLWAAGGRPTPHQEIIAMLRVKRATVSALMFALEQDGLVQSVADTKDRRRLLATLTAKGEKLIVQAMDANAMKLDELMHDISTEELDLLLRLLRKMRERFAAGRESVKRTGSAPA